MMKTNKVFRMLLCLSTLLSGCTNNVIDDMSYLYEMEAALNSASTLIIGNWKMVRLGNKEIDDSELLVTLEISADHKIVYDYNNGKKHQHKESDLILIHNWYPSRDDLLEGDIKFAMWEETQDGNDMFRCLLNKNGKEMVLVPNDGIIQDTKKAMYFVKQE